MKWLPKEKRNPFFVVVAVTVAILLIVYFGLINAQRSTLSGSKAASQAAMVKLQGMEKTIKDGDLTTNEVAAATIALAHAEEDIASGDLYSWAYNTLRAFKQSYKVEIPEIGHPVEGDVDLFPSFPYKQMTFSVSGKGYFHEIGKFVADIENDFPHFRVANLTLEPAGIEG